MKSSSAQNYAPSSSPISSQASEASYNKQPTREASSSAPAKAPKSPSRAQTSGLANGPNLRARNPSKHSSDNSTQHTAPQHPKTSPTGGASNHLKPES